MRMGSVESRSWTRGNQVWRNESTGDIYEDKKTPGNVVPRD